MAVIGDMYYSSNGLYALPVGSFQEAWTVDGEDYFVAVRSASGSRVLSVTHSVQEEMVEAMQVRDRRAAKARGRKHG